MSCPLLDNLYNRGLANQLKISKLTPEQVKEIEPHVTCLAGIKVESTGIVNYKQVCLKYAAIARSQGVKLFHNTRVLDLVKTNAGYTVQTDKGEYPTEFLINCAGLYSDSPCRTSQSQTAS